MAFNKIDSWPGVLLWNKKKKVFIPLIEKNGKKELITLFNLIESNDGNISEIMNKYEAIKNRVILANFRNMTRQVEVSRIRDLLFVVNLSNH